MTTELSSFLGTMAGLAIGVLIVQWLAEREAHRWYRLWADLNMQTLTTTVRAPAATELQPPTTITCTANNKGETLWP